MEEMMSYLSEEEKRAGVVIAQEWAKKQFGLFDQEFCRDALDAYQFKALQETLIFAHAYCPYYKKKFAMLPEIKSMSDFTQLPFVQNRDLVNHGLNFVSTKKEGFSELQSFRTSGTSGVFKRVWFSSEDLERSERFISHFLGNILPADSKILLLRGHPIWEQAFRFVANALRRAGVDFVAGPAKPFDEADIDEYYFPDVNGVVGSPDILHRIAVSPLGKKYKNQIDNVIVSSDILMDFMREDIFKAWGCSVYDHYGSVESGLSAGIECKQSSGYHVREMDLYLEIIDPETGAVLPDGEQGEIVLTTLGERAMPLIRYRSGDIGSITRQRCKCGSPLMRIERIVGRYDGTGQVVFMAKGKF
ncbi:MAG: phenylacetate--CoA ligase family protein [Desulfovibrio sp.]